MTGEGAGAAAAIVGNARTAVWRHDVDIEIHQPLSCAVHLVGCRAVRCVAGGAGESRADVGSVLGETRVSHDVIQVVALAAEGVRPVVAEIRIWKEIRDRLPRRGRLTEFVTPLQDMGPLRAMRPIWPGAAEFTVVVRVMAIRAEDLDAYRASLRGSIQVPHVQQQAGLRQ